MRLHHAPSGQEGEPPIDYEREPPIDYERAVRTLQRARSVEESDYPPVSSCPSVPDAGPARGGAVSDATLIIDCPNEACRAPERAGRDGRQSDGIREWTADFNVVTAGEGTSYYTPVDGEDVLRCPECGERGRVIRY